MSQDLTRFFQAEAEDLVAKIGSALDAASAEPAGADDLRELRRWAHTLKGAAQVVRREDIAQAAHHLESALDAFSEPSTGLSGRASALHVLNGIRRMLLPAAAAPAPSAQPAQEDVPAHPARDVESLRVELRDLDKLLQAINESAILTQGIRRSLEPLARARELTALLRKRSASSSAYAAPHLNALGDEIDDLLSQARRELEASAGMVSQEIDDLRALAERLRLVRADSIVQVLEQAMQASASESGKSVRLEAVGGDLEFDAHLLLEVRDALIQIVRNAVAHGIEMPAERRARGKNDSGTIRVAFRHQGARNVIAVHDDGRGIDFEALRGRAVRSGWMSSIQAREASSEQLTELLLRPGVTTASSPGMIAGRGIGLDIVSRALLRLKGDLRIKAIPGQGTSFEISLPASLNMLSALIVSAGGRTFGMPRDSIVRTLSISSLDRLGASLVVDGRATPYLPLADLMELKGETCSVALLVAADSRAWLLGVNALLGIRPVVLHALPEFLQAEPFLLGAAVDAGGGVLPILDPLLAEAALDEHLRRLPESSAQLQPLPILVVDDSLTTRMLEKSIFEMEGYRVELAGSAEEALAMTSGQRFGLFLVDVELPGMDGFAFVETIGHDPALRDIPAILVTSKGSPEDRARGLKAGAREYVVKSEFDQRLLIRRVKELIRVAS